MLYCLCYCAAVLPVCLLRNTLLLLMEVWITAVAAIDAAARIVSACKQLLLT
jgi:hypothetical protein